MNSWFIWTPHKFEFFSQNLLNQLFVAQMTQQYKFLAIQSLQHTSELVRNRLNYKLEATILYFFTTYITNCWTKKKKCKMVILIWFFWYNDCLLIFIKEGEAEIVAKHAFLAYYQERKKNKSWKLLLTFFIDLTQRSAKKVWKMHFILPKKLLPYSRYSNFCTSHLPSFPLC